MILCEFRWNKLTVHLSNDNNLRYGNVQIYFLLKKKDEIMILQIFDQGIQTQHICTMFNLQCTGAFKLWEQLLNFEYIPA